MKSSYLSFSFVPSQVLYNPILKFVLIHNPSVFKLSRWCEVCKQ